MPWDARVGGGTATKTRAVQQTEALDYADSVAAGLPSIFNVKAYGATGNGSTNDTTAVQAALDAAVAAGGGFVWFPKGTYLANGLTFGSNLIIAGCGWGAAMKQVSGVADNTRLLAGFGTTTNTTGNVVNTHIRDLQLLGRIDTDAATQYVHLLSFSGCSDCTVERVLIKGFRGDGIIFASNDAAGTQVERHNENITVRYCKIDGINKLNRNGITISDGTDITIERCFFTNCTATNRPGAIDIEPNTVAYARLIDIEIDRNRFVNCGGNAGVIGLFLNSAQTFYTLPMRGLRITRNAIRSNTNSQGPIFLNQVQTTTDTTARNDVVVWGNNVRDNVGVPLEAWGMRGLDVIGNIWHNHTLALAFGYASRCKDVEVHHNAFSLIGTSEGNNVTIYNADRVTMRDNEYDGAGAIGRLVAFGDGTGGVASSTNIEVSGAVLVGAGAVASTKSAGHTLSAATNLWDENPITSIVAQFAEIGITPPVATTTQAANYTLVRADEGTVIECTKATAQTVTVPLNSTVPFPIGTIIEIAQMAAGTVTLTPVSGSVAIRSAGGLLNTRTLYSVVSLRKRATDEWVASGDLA